MQRESLEATTPLLPDGADICLMADRFYGTADLIGLCQEKNRDFRLRLKGNLVVRDEKGRSTTGQRAGAGHFALENVQLTARKATTHTGTIQDPGHAEPWIIAMPSKPGYLRTLDYSVRWAIEPMFSDFKSRGFGVEDTRIQYPDRIDAYCRSLARFPDRGHRRDGLREGLRVVGMDRRLTIQFQVIGQEVVIARLLYGDRQE